MSLAVAGTAVVAEDSIDACPVVVEVKTVVAVVVGNYLLSTTKQII